MADPLKGFPIVVIINVAWGELDAQGQVHSSVVFRYFETARIAYLDAVGFLPGARVAGVGPLLHSTMCRFRRPLGFPDTLRVGARMTSTEDDRLTLEHRVVSAKLDEVAAEGASVVVAFDQARQAKVALPAGLRTRVASLERGVETDRTVRGKPRGR